MFAPTSPVTGGLQTGLTTPGYNIIVDNAPDTNSKQWAVVTPLVGTQTGVTVSSTACPFTLTASRPKTFKVQGKPNPVTGLLANVPMNTFKILVRKGVLPLAGQPYATSMHRSLHDIPAGSDVADPLNLKAGLSLYIGALNQQSAGWGDSFIQGTI